MMKNFRRMIVILLTLLISFVFIPTAFAHPLGNFTINQYVGLNVQREKIIVDYVVDMAEIPAFQEITLFDANGNSQADPDESVGYHADKCISLQAHLNLHLNHQTLDLILTSSSVEFPTGSGGLPTLRLTCEFQAVIESAQNNIELSFVNSAFPDRLGWKEIVLLTDGVSVQGGFSTTSLSNRLTNYPQDLLTSPLDERRVEFRLAPLEVPAQNQASVTSVGGTSPLTDRNDAFTRLILLDELSFPTLVLALVIAFVWGAMHAMTPGHGKTIVGAYLVGSRGTMKHALYLGLTTTITHTLGVFAFGLITLFAAQYLLPEQLYPWMSLLSGLFVVGIGLNLFFSRFKSSVGGALINSLKAKLVKSPRQYLPVLQLSSEGTLRHQHKYVLQASNQQFHSHDHRHPHYHEHTHDHTDRSHLPPGADGSPVTWRSLLALGISGGILPCPSALVVLLGAIALNKIGFGLILVLVFSLGLASALTAIGMLFIYAGRLFDRFSATGKMIQVLPALSALFISLIGIAISIKAFSEIGIL